MSEPAPATSADPRVSMVERPPTSALGILSRLGPGMILAGSIVGSGELIGTTSTGGKAGFTLLWLILIGCVIKVFVQVEFGRYSIVTGKTTMEGLSALPGPRAPRLGNWIIWYWVIMMISSLGQLGGIVGGVGQSLAISMPLTQAGRDYNQMMQRRTEMEVRQAELRLRQRENSSSARDEVVRLQAEVDALRKTMQDAAQSDTRYQTIFDIWQAEQRLAAISDRTQAAGKTQAQQIAAELKPLRAQLESYGHAVGEDRTWACIVTVVTAIILVLGRYRFIETATTTFVAGFTAITVLNVFLLQLHPAWAMTWDDLRSGLTFQLPQSPSGAGGLGAVATALATFGIIGVGTNELLAYPYFCIEKGYARFTGPRDKTEDWAARARGWMRVMRVDAWCSMVVYTFATVAFYILGASILGPIMLNPEGTEMIRTLAVMYEPIFGSYAPALFLFGAFAVLYSTFFVANAGHARVTADVIRVVGNGRKDQQAFHRWVLILSGFLPFLCLFMYLAYPKPQLLVLFSGFLQNLMLPMVAGAALYFRYRMADPRVRPTPLWDAFLWLSAIGLLIVAIWALSNFPADLSRILGWRS